jgi:orotidine-5'-phosphate decarboxylase
VSNDSPLIVALDTADPGRLAHLAESVAAHAGLVKVGLQAYTALGPAAVTAAGAHAPVFLDLKLHDIPNTVTGAAAAAADLGIAMLTVHASGGPAMVAAAAKAAPDVAILAVTVLTSLDDDELALLGHPPAPEQVPRLARMAVENGAAGVVCSPHEIAAVREAVGSGPFIVVPGIRPWGTGVDDQARTATPADAIAAGATHLVIGRPITQAADPAAACRQILAELDR